MGRLRSIDNHVHLYSVKQTGKVRQSLARFQIPDDRIASLPPDFDSVSYFRHAAPLGVAAAVDLFVANRGMTPAQVMAVNLEKAAMAAGSNGRLTVFGGVNPHHHQQDIKAELDQVVALGLRGVKLHPKRGSGFQEFNPDDPGFSFLYKQIADRGLHIYWHTGFSGKKGDLFGLVPRQAARISDQYPGLTMTLAHLAGRVIDAVVYGLEGGFEAALENTISWLADKPNISLDLAYVSAVLTDVQVRQVIERFGHERIMGGHDFPYMGVDCSLKDFTSLNLPPHVVQAILWDNPIRILGLSEPA